MTYLLDTNILSETRRRQAATGVMDWIATTAPELLHVSVLTLGEIEHGIARIRGRRDHEQAVGLERWLREVELGFAARHARGSFRMGAPAALAATSRHRRIDCCHGQGERPHGRHPERR